MTLQSDKPRTKLATLRLTVFLIWFFVVLFSPLRQLAELPKEIFTPVGPVRFLSDSTIDLLLAPVSLYLLKVFLTAGLLYSAITKKFYLPTAILSVILLIFHQSLIRGFGHVNHREVPLLLVAMVLVLFPPRCKISREEKKCADADFSLKLATFIFLLTYVATAAHRIAHCVPDIFQNGTMTRFLGYTALRTDYYGFRWEALLLNSPFLLTLLNLGFVTITVIELLSFLCLTSRRFRFVWLSLIIPFHVFSLVFLNIFFWHNLLLCLILLTSFNQFAYRTWRSRFLSLPHPIDLTP
jgi:hypothetical protein